MSVLIKGMEMPTCCMDCPLSMSVNFGLVCCPSSTILPDNKLFDNDGNALEKPVWCPLIEVPIDYDELLKVAKAMHTWIFLNSVDEQEAYDECGLTDEMNAFLGYAGSFTVITTDKDGET